MLERNLCKEAGCSACCCHDAYFSNGYFVTEIKRYFPNAKKVRNLSGQSEIGVYYTSFLGCGIVRIIGPCPNLSEDGDCLIYGWKPEDCWGMSIGSDNCVLFRRVQEQRIKMCS